MLLLHKKIHHVVFVGFLHSQAKHCKVYVFLEGNKIWQNLHRRFDII